VLAGLAASGLTGPSRRAPVLRRRIRTGLALRIWRVGRTAARAEDDDRGEGEGSEAHSQYDEFARIQANARNAFGHDPTVE
jgi:hypothetical protein